MRNILLLGATSAIAQATARRFARRGDRFVLVARDARKLQIVADDLTAHGAARVDTLAADLADVGGHEAILWFAVERLTTLDIVLLAYGTLSDQAACELCPATAHRELAVNFTSAACLLLWVAAQLEQQRRGCLAAISSVAGDRGRRSNYVYGAAKGGLSIFLQGLRARLSRVGVAVVTIKPGFVDTPMTAGVKKNPLFVDAEAAGRGIERAILRRRAVAYVPGFWRWITLAIRLIPEPIFKRLNV